MQSGHSGQSPLQDQGHHHQAHHHDADHGIANQADAVVAEALAIEAEALALAAEAESIMPPVPTPEPEPLPAPEPDQEPAFADLAAVAQDLAEMSALTAESEPKDSPGRVLAQSVRRQAQAIVQQIENGTTPRRDPDSGEG